jgi:ubiquinone biosynthesis protein COQ9
MILNSQKSNLLTAILPHVAFDGWSQISFNQAVSELSMDPNLAAAVAPRGSVDLAVAFHRAGDKAMSAAYNEAETGSLNIRSKVTLAVRLRLETIKDKEVARRGSSLFALPKFAADGAKLIWETADHIWITLGDTTSDFNWYTKRVTLGAVYTATLLFWLGDDSSDHQDTWAFLDRRNDDIPGRSPKV